MLVSHEYKFIVALPTKCGTNSMRNMGLKHARDVSAAELQELPILRHRMDVPEGCEDYKRAMVVRNPMSRLVSMYEYLRRHSWEWRYPDLIQWEHSLGRAGAWTKFLEMLLEEQQLAALKPYGKRKIHGRRPYIWTDRMVELARFLGGTETGQSFPWPAAEVEFLRLEDLAADWWRFAAGCGWGHVAGLPMPKKANATRDEDKLWPDWKRYYTRSRNMELGREIVGLDMVFMPQGRP
jgi:hypothetical protein